MLANGTRIAIMLVLATAVVVAPMASVNAQSLTQLKLSLQDRSGCICCGSCSAASGEAVRSCCATHDRPSTKDGSNPCENDCSQCPLCNPPSPLFVFLDTSLVKLSPPLISGSTPVVNDRFDSNFVEPLLPPPIV